MCQCEFHSEVYSWSNYKQQLRSLYIFEHKPLIRNWNANTKTSTKTSLVLKTQTLVKPTRDDKGGESLNGWSNCYRFHKTLHKITKQNRLFLIVVTAISLYVESLFVMRLIHILCACGSRMDSIIWTLLLYINVVILNLTRRAGQWCDEIRVHKLISYNCTSARMDYIVFNYHIHTTLPPYSQSHLFTQHFFDNLWS